MPVTLREELIDELEALCVEDPRELWNEAIRNGLAAGIDEVFHFFFDDHDFDQTEVGLSLRNLDEVAAIARLKASLDALLLKLGDVGDDLFVSNDGWSQVRSAANEALARLSA